MFQLKQFPFTVAVNEWVTPDGEELCLQFTFQRRLTQEQRHLLYATFGDWQDHAVDQGVIHYSTDEPTWIQGREATYYIDTGGNSNPLLSSYFSDVIERIAASLPLVRVDIIP